MYRTQLQPVLVQLNRTLQWASGKRRAAGHVAWSPATWLPLALPATAQQLQLHLTQVLIRKFAPIRNHLVIRTKFAPIRNRTNSRSPSVRNPDLCECATPRHGAREELVKIL